MSSETICNSKETKTLSCGWKNWEQLHSLNTEFAAILHRVIKKSLNYSLTNGNLHYFLAQTLKYMYYKTFEWEESLTLIGVYSWKGF